MALALAGFLLVVMGLYFMFIRPPLLPEDLRYMGTTSKKVNENIPSLLTWLQKVFLVMGGFIFTTGLLTFYISVTSFRTRSSGIFTIATFAGISSIVLMTVVNFIIGSDFRLPLLTFTLLWAFALILYRFNK